jgi:hypothetical protein
MPGLAGSDLHAVLFRASWRGAGVVVGLAAGVGLLLFGPLSLLAGEAAPFYASGVGLALLAGMLALFLHGRFLDPRTTAPFARDARLLAGRLQGLLAAAFAAKLGVLALAFFALRQFGAKFADTAVLCIAFAACALVYQLVTACFLARALQPRAAALASGQAAPGGGAR